MNRILIDIIVAGLTTPTAKARGLSRWNLVIAAVIVIAIAASAYKSGPQPMWSLN